MAAGDITRDTGSPRTAGNLKVLTGTIEVDDVLRTFALMATNSRLVGCQLDDEDGVGSARVAINANAAGTATNGSIAVYGNSKTVQTYRFTATFM